MTPNRDFQGVAKKPGDAGESAESLARQIQDLLTCLLGRQVTARKAGLRFGSASPVVRAVFYSDDGAVRAQCVCDLPLAICSGAALGLFPANVAKEATIAQKIPDAVLENFREVLNVCTRLVGGFCKEHVGLREVLLDKTPPKAVPGSPEIEITVAGYGGGRLTLQRLG